jgi:hypothetical protein
MQVIEVQVQDDYLKRISRTKPFAALCELVWNACDADATKIDVDIRRNLISGVDSIEITDNGLGIFRENQHQFSQLGSSWKALAGRTRKKNRVLHGRNGQGRFKAFALGSKVSWETQFDNGTKIDRYEIYGSYDSPKKFQISDISEPFGESTGTTVRINNVFDEASRFCDKIALNDFASEFALYLKNYPEISIRIDGHPIKLDEIISDSSHYPVGPFTTEHGTTVSGQLDIIEWKQTMARSIHLCDNDGVTRSERPADIRAPGFDFTAYLRSETIDRLAKDNLLDLEMSAELNL